MSDRPELPHRRHRLTINLEADSIREIETALDEIGASLSLDDAKGRDWSGPYDVTAGGHGIGWHVRLESDLSVTGDDYRTALKEWHDQVRAERRTARD